MHATINKSKRMHTHIAISNEKCLHSENDCECLFEKLKSICVICGTKSRDKSEEQKRTQK